MILYQYNVVHISTRATADVRRADQSGADYLAEKNDIAFAQGPCCSNTVITIVLLYLSWSLPIPPWRSWPVQEFQQLSRQHGHQRSVRVNLLHIDHRKHFELAWERQQQREARLQEEASSNLGGVVTEAVDLLHWEQLQERAGKLY